MELARRRPDVLDPDAINYLQLAEEYSFLTWVGGFREPIWHSILAVPVEVFGPHPTLVRLLGLVGFLLLVVAVYIFAGRFLSEIWAGLCAMAIAASPWLVFQAPRGLREETAAALVLMMAAAFTSEDAGSRLPWLGLGVGLLALLRWDTLILTLPLLGMTAVMRRDVSFGRGAVSLLMAIVVTAPFFVGNAVRFDDPMYHSNIAAVFFRNMEFAGEPGLPTPDEVVEDAFAGPHETWATYLFERHTTAEVLLRSARGVVHTTLNVAALGLFHSDAVSIPVRLPDTGILQGTRTLLPWLLAIAGFVGAVLQALRGRWQLLVLVVFAVSQHAPIAQMMDMRLAITVYPVLVVGAVAAVNDLTARSKAKRYVCA